MYRFSLLVSLCVHRRAVILASVCSLGGNNQKRNILISFLLFVSNVYRLMPRSWKRQISHAEWSFLKGSVRPMWRTIRLFPFTLTSLSLLERERERISGNCIFFFFFFFLIFVDFLVFGRLTCVCHLSGIPASNEPWTLAVRSCRHILPELLLFLTTTTTRNSSYSGCFRKLTFFLPFPLPLTSEGDHSNRDAANEDFRSCTYIRVLSWWAHFAVGICSWWRFSFLHFIFSLFLPLILFFKIRTSADICLARGVKWVVTLAHFFFFLLFSRKQSSNARHLFQKTFVSVFPPLNKFKKKTHTHTKKLINSSI